MSTTARSTRRCPRERITETLTLDEAVAALAAKAAGGGGGGRLARRPSRRRPDHGARRPVRRLCQLGQGQREDPEIDRARHDHPARRDRTDRRARGQAGQAREGAAKAAAAAKKAPAKKAPAARKKAPAKTGGTAKKARGREGRALRIGGTKKASTATAGSATRECATNWPYSQAAPNGVIRRREGPALVRPSRESAANTESIGTRSGKFCRRRDDADEGGTP